jgi:hypothetical protein
MFIKNDLKISKNCSCKMLSRIIPKQEILYRMHLERIVDMDI